jgi:hypothetical protein
LSTAPSWSPSTPGPATPRASWRTAGLEAGSAASLYKKQFGLDVKFVLLEDPAAKLAAFRNGEVDIMWNTVDNWAREASILAEQNQKAKPSSCRTGRAAATASSRSPRSRRSRA